MYDAVILGLSCRFMWRCPRGVLLDLYNRYVRAKHLDVGPGTGYFLDRCTFPSEQPKITLLDLSEAALAKATRRLARYDPEARRANVLEPIDLAGERFDSIALSGVLHCLPATIDEKAAVFVNLRQCLTDDGVLFGSTILGRGVEHNRVARLALTIYNREHIFTNLQDDPEGLGRALSQAFPHVDIELRGSFALFAARP